jgi:hypothetical protein
MKNAIFIVVALACSFQTSLAQFSFGVKAEYTLSTAPSSSLEIISSSRPVQVHNLNYLRTKDQISYGLSLYNENDLLWVNLDLLYGKTESLYSVENLIGGFQRNISTRELNVTETQLSLPLSAGLKFNNIKIGGGPILNYTLNTSNQDLGVDGLVESREKITGGFQFLVGYIIKDRFHIDLKREFNFTDVGKNYTFEGIPTEQNNSPNGISLSLSAFF